MDLKFWNSIKDVLSIDEPLPLIHITDGYGFFEISKPCKLVAQPCKIFDRDLIYTYYGRPAYRTKHNGNSALTANLPCVFIFDPLKIKSPIEAVFPFDTGAFEAGRYSNYFHSQMVKEDFLLPSDLNSAQTVVSHFYQNNTEYFYGESRKNVQFEIGEFEIEAYQEMARTSGLPQKEAPQSYDDRASAIEIHFKEEINLENALIGCILPYTFLDSPVVKDALAKMNPEIIKTYKTIQNLTSEGLAGKIYDLVETIYTEKGFIE